MNMAWWDWLGLVTLIPGSVVALKLMIDRARL